MRMNSNQIRCLMLVASWQFRDWRLVNCLKKGRLFRDEKLSGRLDRLGLEGDGIFIDLEKLREFIR